MKKSLYLEVLGNRKFMFLWLAQITSQIALNMLSFVLAIRVYQETGSNTAVSLMLLSFSVPAVVFGVLAGGIVDYFDKRKILLICNFSRVLMFFLFFITGNNLILIYALSVVTSIITQLFIPAEVPSIANLVPSGQIMTANSLFTVSYFLSTFTGFILAGPFVRLLGPYNVYFSMIILMIIASYFVYLLPAMKSSEKKKGFLPSFGYITRTIEEGMNFIRTNPRIKAGLLLMTLSQALISTLAVLAPGFADKILSINLTDSSLLVLGPAAVGLVIGALWVGGWGMKYLKGKIITWGIFLAGVNLILLSFLTSSKTSGFFLSVESMLGINHLIIASFLLFILGIANSLINIPANTVLQQDSNSDMRGRVYGVLTSATGGVSLLPVIFSGILADAIGVGQALSVIGFFVLAIGIIQYLKRRHSIVTIK